MAIEYERVNWDTTKYVNPTNMNQMDAGIKAACDGVDENSSAITAINSKLEQHTAGTAVDISSYTSKAYVTPSDGYLEVGVAYGSGNYNYVEIVGFERVQLASATFASQRILVFVKKGMRLVQSASNGTIYSRFIPLI